MWAALPQCIHILSPCYKVGSSEQQPHHLQTCWACRLWGPLPGPVKRIAVRPNNLLFSHVEILKFTLQLQNCLQPHRTSFVDNRKVCHSMQNNDNKSPTNKTISGLFCQLHNLYEVNINISKHKPELLFLTFNRLWLSSRMQYLLCF